MLLFFNFNKSQSGKYFIQSLSFNWKLWSDQLISIYPIFKMALFVFINQIVRFKKIETSNSIIKNFKFDFNIYIRGGQPEDISRCRFTLIYFDLKTTSNKLWIKSQKNFLLYFGTKFWTPRKFIKKNFLDVFREEAPTSFLSTI